MQFGHTNYNNIWKNRSNFQHGSLLFQHIQLGVKNPFEITNFSVI